MALGENASDLVPWSLPIYSLGAAKQTKLQFVTLVGHLQFGPEGMYRPGELSALVERKRLSSALPRRLFVLAAASAGPTSACVMVASRARCGGGWTGVAAVAEVVIPAVGA